MTKRYGVSEEEDGVCCVPGCKNPESRRHNGICLPHLCAEDNKWRAARRTGLPVGPGVEVEG